MRPLQIILLSFLFSCSLKKSNDQNIKSTSDQGFINDIPNTAIVDSKTIALDSNSSKGLKKCGDNPINITTLQSCTIRKDNLQYIRETTSLFSPSGKINGFYLYLSEGPSFYSENELENDTMFFNYYHLSKSNKISIDKNKKIIVDNFDTFKIVDHWVKEKLLFVMFDSLKVEKGRCLIYSYH